PGDRVRAARVHHDRFHAPAALREVAPSEHDRSRLEAVLREECRGGGTLLRHDERHVRPLLANAGADARREEARRKSHRPPPFLRSAVRRRRASRAAAATRRGAVPPKALLFESARFTSSALRSLREISREAPSARSVFPAASASAKRRPTISC